MSSPPIVTSILKEKIKVRELIYIKAKTYKVQTSRLCGIGKRIINRSMEWGWKKQLRNRKAT